MRLIYTWFITGAFLVAEYDAFDNKICPAHGESVKDERHKQHYLFLDTRDEWNKEYIGGPLRGYSWREAQDKCRRMKLFGTDGGFLPEPKSPYENAFLDRVAFACNVKPFLGLRKIGTSGRWNYTHDNRRVKYTNWSKKCPKKHSDFPLSPVCAIMNGSEWCETFCHDREMTFVCVWKAVPPKPRADEVGFSLHHYLEVTGITQAVLLGIFLILGVFLLCVFCGFRKKDKKKSKEEKGLAKKEGAETTKKVEAESSPVKMSTSAQDAAAKVSGSPRNSTNEHPPE